MKKFFLCILFIILIPLNINAVSVTTTEIMGMEEKTIGEKLSLSFKVSYDGLHKGQDNSFGLWYVNYELIFDDSILDITGISSNTWDSVVYKENGKYYVLSEIGEDDPSKNKCADGILYCADYIVTLEFYVKETTKDSTTIKMGNIETGVFDISLSEYNDENMVIVKGTSDKVHTLKLKQPDIEIEEGTTTIVENKKPSIPSVEEKLNDIVSNDNKSDNNYLSSLKIDGYTINFDKQKNEYELAVSHDVNSLKFDIVTEDEEAFYKIEGADDLDKSNGKVSITVTAPNNEKRIYKINVMKEKEVLSNDTIDEEKDSSIIDIIKEYSTIIQIVLITILSIVIIIIIVKRVKESKLEKEINKL